MHIVLYIASAVGTQNTQTFANLCLEVAKELERSLRRDGVGRRSVGVGGGVAVQVQVPHINLAETERRRQDDDAIPLNRQLRQHAAVAHSVSSKVSALVSS